MEQGDQILSLFLGRAESRECRPSSGDVARGAWPPSRTSGRLGPRVHLCRPHVWFWGSRSCRFVGTPRGFHVRHAALTFPGSILIALLVLVAYLPALRAGYLWDDDYYVVHNSNLVRPDGMRRIWFEPQRTVQYYPLVHTVLRAEYRLWHLHPFGYHLVNVLLHALNSILLWRILRHLAVPGAWLIACIFGLHPVHVESVAWISEIKNLLSGLFF